MDNISIENNVRSDLFKLYEQYMSSSSVKTTRTGNVQHPNILETISHVRDTESGSLGIPELGDGFALQPLDVDKLENAMAALQMLSNSQQLQTEQVGQEVKSAGYAPVNEVKFSLVKLMQLITETAKDMKQAAREGRNAALKSEMAQMQAEAQMQRLAGLYGMVVGLCFSGLQIGMTAGSGIASVVQMKSQLGMMKTPELENGTQNIKMLEKAQTAPAAADQTAKTQSSLKINEAKAQQLKQDFFAGAEQKKTDFEAANGQAQPDLAVTEQARTDARNAYDEGMDRYDQAIMDKQAQVEQLEARVKAQPQAQPQQPDPGAQPGAQQQVPAPGDQQPQPTVAEQLAAAKKELDELKAQRPFMKAVQLEGKAQVSTKAQLKNDLVTAQEDQAALSKLISSSSEYRQKDIMLKRMDLLQGFSQTLSGFSQSFGGFVQGKYQAAATEHQAEAKKAEMDRESASDFVHSAQDLINAVGKLAADIVNMERDTNQQIIRG